MDATVHWHGLRLENRFDGTHETQAPIPVVLAPSERIVIDVLFTAPGQMTLEHHTPDRTYPLAAITVTEEPASPLRQPARAPVPR